MAIVSRLLRFLGRLYHEWSGNNVPALAAALAFYTLFSAGPLLLVMLFLGGSIVGGIEQQLPTAIEAATHIPAESLVQALVTSYALIKQSAILNVVGLVVLLLAATRAFSHLQHSLNVVWHVPDKHLSFWKQARRRLIPFALILVLTLLLIFSLVVQVFLGVIATKLHLFPFLARAVHIVITLSLTAALFAAAYKILPNKKLAWHDVWFASFLTAILFYVGESLISVYFALVPIGSTYGAAGSVIALLLWVYYSSQVFLLGAVLTKLRWDRHARVRIPHVLSLKKPRRGA